MCSFTTLVRFSQAKKLEELSKSLKDQNQELTKTVEDIQAAKASLEQESSKAISLKEEECKTRVTNVENEMRELLRIMDEQKDRHSKKMQQVAVFMQSLNQS